MKKKLKDLKRFIVPIILLWFVFLVVFISTSNEKSKPGNVVSWEDFSQSAALIVNNDKVGAKVTLKEAIHGTDGIVYRYILKTDCPSWDYEDRYATTTPISWATDDTAAVEVLIYDAQVRYEGTAYASGTYYTVPLFVGVASEDIPLEDWENTLIKQAYQVYASEGNGDIAESMYVNIFWMISVIWVFGLPIVLIIYACIPAKGNEKKDSTNPPAN